MSKKDFQYKSIIVKRLKDIRYNIYNIQNTFWDDLLPANRLLPWILFLVQILWISLQNCFQTLYFLDNLFHLRHPQQKTLENPEFPKNAKLFTMAIRCKWFYYHSLGEIQNIHRITWKVIFLGANCMYFALAESTVKFIEQFWVSKGKFRRLNTHPYSA